MTSFAAIARVRLGYLIVFITFVRITLLAFSYFKKV